MVIDLLISVLLVLLALKLSPVKHWTVQWPGYLLRQVSGTMALLLTLKLFLYPDEWSNISIAIFGTGTIAAIICAFILYPYTRFGKKSISTVPSEENQLSIVISNLKFDNSNFDDAIKAFQEQDPDILVLLEVTEEWKSHLLEKLVSFSFECIIPRSDPFGMGVFSKYPIGQHEVFHIYNSTPTLKCMLDYNGTECEFWVLHPKPPAPGDADTSEPLDFEFMKVSDMIDGSKNPTIVAGDMNEVAWSSTTRKFLKRANLNDLRRGRGFIATFPTYAPWLGFPLDQVFVSDHWQVSTFEKLRHIGSDHYPLLTRLVLSDKKK